MAHTVGYCCINMTLGKQGITTGRTMRQATFKERGLSYVSELATQNIQDLIKILEWNSQHDITLFRMSSNLFPWNSEYELSQLPDHETHVELLQRAGNIALSTNQRITAHPDHYVKLASENERVAKNAIHDLHHHNELFDIMGLPPNHYHCLNIHVGQNFSEDVINRFIQRYHMLNDNTKKRLVVENDDKGNAFSVKQLYDNLHKAIDIPITFDYFHHTFHEDSLTSEEAATLSYSTWDCKPLFHYSESKNLNEHVEGNPRAHADYVFQRIDDYGLNIDVDLEAKAKELAYFKYIQLETL